MFYFLLFQTNSINTVSEDDIRLKCAICNKIVNYHQTNTTAEKISPKESSFCTKNSDSMWCTFIQEVSEQYLNATTREKIDFCYLKSLCFTPPDPSLTGPRCEACVFLANHLMKFPPEQQRQAFSDFCITSKSTVSSLCADIEDESLNSFMREINEMKDAEEVCKAQHFCRIKKNRNRKDTTEDNQEENNQKQEEL